MQQVARVTELLPVLNNVQADLSFVPPSHQLDFIWEHPDFASAYEDGFAAFTEDGIYSVVSTFHKMQVLLANEIFRSYRPGETIFGVCSLPFRAGFCLGWLSALAPARRDLARMGFDLLPTFVKYAYQDETGRGHNPLVEVPGIVKSPLRDR